MCKITQPKIRYYAKMVLNTSKGKKTPKYTIQNAIGYYPPMSELIGKDGKVSFYIKRADKELQNVPPMQLQAKRSLNFTGLKDYFVDGKLSGYAYGYPYDKPTYSSNNTPSIHKKDTFYLDIVSPFLLLVEGGIFMYVLKHTSYVNSIFFFKNNRVFLH